MNKPGVKTKDDSNPARKNKAKPQKEEREPTPLEKFDRLAGKYQAELSKPEAVEYFKHLRGR